MPSTKGRALPPCYCIAWRRTSNVLTEFYDRAFADLGISIAQYSLLKNIGRLGKCNKTELAEVCRLERSTIVRNLAVLQKRGFIDDAPEATSRNKVIQLTESGRELIEKGGEVWQRQQAAVEEAIGAGNMPLFWRMLESINALGG